MGGEGSGGAISRRLTVLVIGRFDGPAPALSFGGSLGVAAKMTHGVVRMHINQFVISTKAVRRGAASREHLIPARRLSTQEQPRGRTLLHQDHRASRRGPGW